MWMEGGEAVGTRALWVMLFFGLPIYRMLFG